MLAFIEEFGLEAGLFCIIGEGVKIHIEPVERLTKNILVLHLVVYLTIIIISQIDHHTSVFFLIQIAEVA